MANNHLLIEEWLLSAEQPDTLKSMHSYRST